MLSRPLEENKSKGPRVRAREAEVIRMWIVQVIRSPEYTGLFLYISCSVHMGMGALLIVCNIAYANC